MEKIIISLVCVLCALLIIISVSLHKKPANDTFTDSDIGTSHVYADGSNKLISSTYYDHEFHTVIKSENGKILDSIDSINEPEIKKINDSTFAVTISYGTGLSTLETYVYNLENSKKEKYVGMLTFINDNIVYASDDDVVIQKVFTQKKNTISDFTYAPADINEIPFVSAEYDSDSKKLNITYCYGYKLNYQTDSFDVSSLIS